MTWLSIVLAVVVGAWVAGLVHAEDRGKQAGRWVARKLGPK